MFALYYSAEDKKIRALNGSGRAPAKATLEGVRKDLGIADSESGTLPMSSVHAVITPGAAAGWVDVVEKFGNKKLSMEQILKPAIELAEEGFPVSELSAQFWQDGEEYLRKQSPNCKELLKPDSRAKDGVRAPRPGELIKNKELATTFKLLAMSGKKGFYSGVVAESIIKVVQDAGGYLDSDDLLAHCSAGTEEVEPISIKFNGQGVVDASSHPSTQGSEQDNGHQGVEVWECPPNGQGIVALMALGILEELEKTGMIRRFNERDHNSAEYLHAVIESLRIAFADGRWWITDPSVNRVPIHDMLSSSYLSKRAKLFNSQRASDFINHGSPAFNHSDTVYFAVTDQWGNGISFINSLYGGFGSGMIPAGCGFALHSRGANFSLDANHPNVFAPNKRPYHTIIPAMITNPTDDSLNTVYGVMGGFMQPQGHVQVLLNMFVFKHDPQVALDAPRICIGAGTPDMGKVLDQTVYLEEGISEHVAVKLQQMGHWVEFVNGSMRGMFGRGQVIRVHEEDGRRVYSAGSDPRGDGAAIPL
ncbi:MAG: hypothetical protein M1823_000991 [Watsoniomyces obsoletus]|nr:MAG: hypothetical protein M1823_000991 [Watsoniomyces obsoletus]